MSVPLLPDGYQTVFPYIFVKDAAAFIAFLQRAFAASEIARVVGEQDRVVNAQIRIGNSQFMVSEAVADFPPMPASYYIFVEHADDAMALAVANGATEIMPVADRPYQDRQGGVRDPFGNLWWISQRLVPGPYA
jgi:PhnB protein